MSVSDQVRRIAIELRAVLESFEPGLDSDAEREYAHIADALDGCLGQLRQLNLWGPENRSPSSELWNMAANWLERGWLQNRARTKPRGYAGDYEMLARIYEQRLCDDPLGRLFDRYFQQQAAPIAVRHRMRMMSEWIVELASGERQLAGRGRQPPEPDRPLRVAIFGSAFGLEVRDALLRLAPPARDRLHVTLLDLDPAAIEFARRQLAPLLRPEQLLASAANLFRLPDRPPLAELLSGADLMLCPGLFDYLDDDAAIAMLRALTATLAPGGRLTIFQFAPHNSTRTYMEWLANWYLIYRDVQQLQALVKESGIAAAVDFGAEPLGLDLYVTIQRSVTTPSAPA